LVLIFIAILAPFIAPHDPIEQNLEHRLLPPNAEYPLGTDNLGRCILSRLIHGTSVSLQIGVIVVGIAATTGVTLGLIAGYRGGLVDELIMRIVDVLLAFPGIILALAIAGILGPSLYNVMLALAVVGWTSYARVVRGSVLSVKEKEFVEAARALGAGEARIMFRHILPNVTAPVIVMATLGMAHVILAAAALSFLGLGAQPPTPEWGSMLNDGRAFMRTAPHLTIFPGLAIMVTVLAFNFLGDGLRDVLDPRLKGAAR
jgi:peptide/nickel transport system permease protein